MFFVDWQWTKETRVRKSVVYFLSSSLKPVGKLELIMAGMFIGWSSRKVMFLFVVDWKYIWKKQDVQRCQKVCGLFLIFFSESTGSIRINLGRNVHFNGKNFLSAMEFDLYLRILLSWRLLISLREISNIRFILWNLEREKTET